MQQCTEIDISFQAQKEVISQQLLLQLFVYILYLPVFLQGFFWFQFWGLFHCCFFSSGWWWVLFLCFHYACNSAFLNFSVFLVQVGLWFCIFTYTFSHSLLFRGVFFHFKIQNFTGLKQINSVLYVQWTQNHLESLEATVCVTHQLLGDMMKFRAF